LKNRLEELQAEVVGCNRCERLRHYCAQVARVKRRAYRDQDYWGKPVPSFGDPQAKLVIIGLAPGAHGSNRTGRMFTGDRSGDFLYAALYRHGLCSQPVATSTHDGLTLNGVYITAVGRCAPPGNKPLPVELQNCRPFLQTELELLDSTSTLLVLGKIAYDGTLQALKEMAVCAGNDNQGFAHGAVQTAGSYTIVSSYHVSQQNTQTGRLTMAMFDAVLQTCLGFS
jgi:uracil-DNA glycosylase family 4